MGYAASPVSQADGEASAAALRPLAAEAQQLLHEPPALTLDYAVCASATAACLLPVTPCCSAVCNARAVHFVFGSRKQWHGTRWARGL